MDLNGYNTFRSLKQTTKEVHPMKPNRFDIICQAYKIPELKFENQTLTSFGGLVLIQQLFIAVGLKTRLKGCFRKLEGGKVFPRAIIFLQLIIHLVLGYRELQDSRYYHDDPLVKRVLGLKRLPDVATLSRMLKGADTVSIENLRHLMRDMLFERLMTLGFPMTTAMNSK